jgi:glycosyltransferase involved in cell wall biosynthesis
MKKFKVCFWPGRESEYIRTKVIKRCLELNDYDVYDCSVPEKNLKRYIKSFLKFVQYVRQCDVIVIGFCGQPLIFIARCFSRKPIVFDVYISIYETLVHERRIFGEKSLAAHVIRFIEKKSCRLADALILDTNTHIDYFSREYQLPQPMFHRVLASCGEVRPPATQPVSLKPKILFYGEFQALHGVPHILQAAHIVRDAAFVIIGDGSLRPECERLAQELKLDHVIFLPYLPYDELLQQIRGADICLGIFGQTPKANMVIPNKVYDYVSLGKAVITQKSEAIGEIFIDGADLICCEAADAVALARAIRRLIDDPPYRERIARQGYQKYVQQCSFTVLAKELNAVMEKATRE